MAELLQNGSIRMRDGRILWGRDSFQIIDFAELSQLLTPKIPTGFTGFGGGGGRGPKGDRGQQGIQGPPGLISLIQSQGFNLPLQNTLNFIGESVSVADDPGNGRLNITIKDLYAATRIVSSDPAQGTDLTIQDAIDNLPAEGGTIFVKQGTYVIATSILLPDKPVKIIGSGIGVTIFSMPTFAGPLFQVSDGLTEVRRYEISEFSAVGGGIAGQEFWRFDDTDGQGDCLAESVRITEFETLVNWAKYNTAYNRQSNFWLNYSETRALGTGSILAKTPNPAGTFGAAVGFRATQTAFFLSDGPTFVSCTWTANADCDLWVDISLGTGPLFIAGTSFNGAQFHANIMFGMNVGTITFFGNGWDCFDFIDGSCYTLSVFGQPGNSTDLVFLFRSGNMSIVGSTFFGVGVRLRNGHITDSKFEGSLGANPMVEFEGGVGRSFEFSGMFSSISGPGTLIKLTDVTRVRISATFRTLVAGQNTIVESGLSDFNLGVGCIGLNEGSGMTIIGANSQFVTGTGINIA